MHSVVTGAAGFVGAALAAQLLRRGDTVVGIDCFLDSYPRRIKEDRLKSLGGFKEFSFVEGDLVEVDLTSLVRNADGVFHLAAQAGVRRSWGQHFEIYTRSNILATQRLLEAVKGTHIRRFVYASSSSVYGDAEVLPTPETAPLRPVSPYAVSKLAGEHLCHLYHVNFGVPTVTLRYFTVYGPRPRPDQAVCIFTRALMEDQEIEVFGDGEQLRGMTYVEDVVRANLLAAEKECTGEVMNIGGGTSITVNQLIADLERITGRKARVRYTEQAKGDARNTLADISRAERVLGWKPEVDTGAGLERTVASIKSFYYPRP
jgi:UDP-glucose 4-epimerase